MPHPTRRLNIWNLREDLGFISTQTALHASSHSANYKHFEQDVQQVMGAFCNFNNPFDLEATEGRELYCVWHV